MSAPAVRSGQALPVGRGRRRRAARPRAPLPRPAVARIALLVAGAGLGATTALTFTAETAGQLRAPGGLATFAGSLTGMIGTYLALMMVLLISRIPLIERVLGQDGLVRWHRRLAPWPISLLVAHAVFTTVGAAQAARNGLGRQVGVMLTQFPDVLIATIGLGIMCLIGVISLRAIRSRLSREAWWLVHLYLYLALALSFAHVIVLGPSFVGHPLTRAVWSLVWAATAGLVLVYRFGLPVARSLRHRLVVTEVRPEGPGVVSVICAGRHLDKAAGGRRAVHVLALSHPGQMVAGPPVLAVSAPAASVYAADRQGGGRLFGLPGPPAPGDAGHGGGPLRSFHPQRAGQAQGPAGGRRDWGYRPAVAAGRPALQLRARCPAAGQPPGGPGAWPGGVRAGPRPRREAARAGW